MSIRRQMILLIALPTLTIYLLVVGLTVVYVYRDTYRSIMGHKTRLAASYAARFDGCLREAARIADTTARVMETVPGISDAQVYDLLARNVEQTKLVYGACMAFEPGTRKPGATLFAPYVCRGADGLRRIDINESVYDWYRDPRFTWYSRPKALNAGDWSEPYFDEGAGNILMTTYSAPFRFVQGGKDRGFGGVNTVDIDLPRLRQVVSHDIEDGVDFIILNKDGRFVYDSDPALIMSETIFDVAARTGNPDLAALGRGMLSGRPGVGTIDNWESTQRQLVFYTPIRSQGWIFAYRLPESVALANARARAAWSTGALALTLALTVACIFYVSSRIARPIKSLQGKVKEVASGNLDVHIAEEGHADEIRQLVMAFNGMTADLRANIRRLAAETATRERIEHDLDIARGIQRGLLPMNRPDHPKYEIVGWNQPAEQTGGDYYDWQMLPDGRTIVTLADVSGHGIGPALVTAVCRAYARASFAAIRDLSPVIAQLNDLLVGDLVEGRFVTLVAVSLDPSSNHAAIISAGHGPILHYVAAKHELVHVPTTDLPLGIESQLPYSPAADRYLGPGDFLLLITDGFFEWANSTGQVFGIKRLHDAILDMARLPCEQIISGLYQRVRDFAGPVPQADDVTAVIVKRNAADVDRAPNDVPGA